MDNESHDRPLVAAAADAEAAPAPPTQQQQQPQPARAAADHEQQSLGTTGAGSDAREGGAATPSTAAGSLPPASPTRRRAASQGADAGGPDAAGGRDAEREGGSPRAAGDPRPKQQQQQKQEHAFEKKEKPKLSRADRRAIQEEQRRLKAEGKKASGKGGGANARGGPGGAAPGAGDAPGEVQRRGSLKSPTAGAGAGGAQSSAGPGGGGGGGGPSAAGGKPRERNAKTTLQFDDKNAVARLAKRSVVPLARQCQISFFRHLPEYEASALDSFVRTTSLESDAGAGAGGDGGRELPPVILKLGLMYARGAVTGGSRRCVAMLNAFKAVLREYETPAGKVLVRDFTSHLGKHIQFLQDCRPMSMSMKNAIRWLKSTINKMATSVANGLSQTDEEAREELLELIDRYIQEKIVFAGKVAARKAATKICDGDCVLVYQPCQVVLRALELAHAGADGDETPGYAGGVGLGGAGAAGGRAGRDFRIVVVESSPSKAGIEFVRRFLRKGIPCTLVTINGIGNVMREVSKVILSASAVHANGTVLARAGTSMISMMARNNNKPVMIVCESCKFSELVQVDSFTYNEIGNPEGMIAGGGPAKGGAGAGAGAASGGGGGAGAGAARGGRRSVLEGYQNGNLSVLNLVYDVTPSEFVTLIVTEFGLVPPTSVPVILRESRNDIGLGI